MKKNFVYNVIYQILILILPLITVPYVSRVLGADGVGTYSYTYSIAYYFMIFAMLGLNNYGNRTIAKVRDNKEKLSKEFCSIYSLQLITSTLMIVFYLLYVTIFDNQYKIIAFIQIMYVISTMFDINWFFFGIEKFKLTITRNTIIKVLSLLLIFIFVKQPGDVWKYTAILSGSTLFSNIVLFTFLKKYVKFKKVTRKDILKHFKPCMILFLPVIATSIYNVISKVMLGAISNVSEVGFYENATKIIQVPVCIATALGTVMLPRASNMISNHQEEKLKGIVEKTMPFIMFLTIPMALGIVAIGKDFSVLFFGKDFEKSGYIMQILAVTIIFLSWGNVIRTQYLIPKEKDKEYTISAFLGAIVNVITNYIFIPIWASIGAAVGNVLAEFSVMFYQTWKVRKDLSMMTYIRKSIRFLITGIIMFIVVIIIGNFIKNIFLKIIIQVIVGGLIYFILNIKNIYNDLGIKNILQKTKNNISIKIKK